MRLSALLALLSFSSAAMIVSAASPESVPTGRFSTAGFYSVPGSPRQVFNFNPGWRFLKADAEGAEKPGFDDSQWELAHVPHGLETLGENASGMRNYQGPAWYRKVFARPASSGRAFLYFESVMGKTTVWLNGHELGRHYGGYLPFAFDVTALLKDGRNVVAVRADNSDDPTYPPGKSQGVLDFAYLGGIYRDVYFIQTDAAHVTLPELSATTAGGGVFVAVKNIKDRDAQIAVRTEVANSGPAPRTFTVRTILENAEGREVLRDEKPISIDAGASALLDQELAAETVRLWHPDDPYLHFVRTVILDGDRVVDDLRTRFGIRLFEMRGKEGFFINKKFISYKLSGVNRHQDYVYVGNALPNSGQWRDAQLLREGGSNVVRAGHYPLDPAFYDACDELGLLTTTANPGWQFFNREDPLFEKRIYEDTRNLVRRDRNRPSILLWETALNETPEQPHRLLAEMHRIAHEEFPFPGLFTVADVDEATAGGLDFAYHADVNSKFNSFTREYGDGGEVDNFFSQNARTRVKREWGEKALLQQALIRVENLREVYGTPPIRIGASIWCGIDHQRGYHPDPFWGGLLDGYRIPRYSYQLFKSQYAPGYRLPGIKTGPMVFIAHELTQVSPSDVVVFTNCDEVRLTWLGQPVGTARPPADSLLPHAPVVFKDAFDYAVISRDWRSRTGEIEMVAEGLIDGKVVVREVKKYPERTTGLKLEVDGAGLGLAAEGSDFIPVRATVVDNKGVPKVLADDRVRFEVEGPAEIIGDNGLNNPMKVQFGVATALIRAGSAPGIIKVRASAPGLDSAEITLDSHASSLPLLFDAAYVAASKKNDSTSPSVAVPKSAAATNAEIEKLRDEVRRLQLELTSNRQDLMELRGKTTSASTAP